MRKRLTIGTQIMFDSPIINTLTATRCDRLEKEGGGRSWKAMICRADATVALAQLAVKAHSDMTIRIVYLRRLVHWRFVRNASSQ